MKKIFSFLLVAAGLVLGLASCEDNNSKAHFAIEVSDITATSATVTIVPTDANELYYFDVMTKDQIDAFGSYDELAEAYLDYIKQDIAQYQGQYTMEDVLSQGTDAYTFPSLSPETEYIAFAFAVDAAYEFTGVIETKTFTTAEVTPSSLQLSLAVSSGILSVTASNNDPYFFFCETTEDYLTYNPDYSEASLAASIEDWAAMFEAYGAMMGVSVSDFVYNGNISGALSSLIEESGEYIAYAAPFAGVVNGTPAYVVFSYTAPSAKAPAQVEIKRIERIQRPEPLVHRTFNLK